MDKEKAKTKPFNARPLFYAFLSLMLAIATSRFIFGGNLKYIIFDAVILGVFLLFSLRYRAFKGLMIVLCVFAFGLGWFFVGLSTFEGKEFSGQVEVSGRISDDVTFSKYGGSATVVLKDVKINGAKESNICLTIKFNNADEFNVGDKITFLGVVEKAKLFELGKFNSFYYRDRTPYVCSTSTENLLVLGNKTTWTENFRLKVKSVLYKNMGERNGAVAYSMFFGDKSDLDGDVYESYRTAGIIHLLTVSGLHVSFLIVLLGWILRKCRIKGIWNFLVCLLFLGAYSMLCNFSPSILRAGIMGLVLFSCALSGKRYDGLSTLGFAGIIILIILPLMALDTGFLMSFFCVLSIYIISPWVIKLLSFIFPNRIAQAFGISIGVEIGILPFLALMSGTFNFLTFFVNLIVVPMFSVVYPFMFVSTFLTWLMPFMGFLLKGSGWFLSLFEQIASFFGGTKLIINLKPFDMFFVAALFVALFLLSNFYMASRKRRAAFCSVAFALGGILFGLSYVQFPTHAQIAYGFNYSNSVVVLTNRKGESAIVDLGYEDWTCSLLDSLGLKKISTLFVLQDATIRTKTAESIGVKNIIRCDGGEGYDNEMLVSVNSRAAFGGFSFTYHASGSRLVGLEISFDGTSVFILRDWNLTEKQLSILPADTFDYVLLGKHDNYAQHFDKRSRILTYYTCNEATASYQKNGNMSFKTSRKQTRRCLD